MNVDDTKKRTRKRDEKKSTTIQYSITMHSVFSFDVYDALKIESTLRSDAYCGYIFIEMVKE